MATLSTIDVENGELFPLFSNLGFETAAVCNRHCVFCPNHDFVRPDQYMPMSLIRKCFTELGELKFKGRLALYIYNEPLRDKRILDILALARKLSPRTVLMLSTNGDYLTEKLLDELFDAGLNQFAINVYSAQDGDSDKLKVAKGIAQAKKRAKLFQNWLDKRPHLDQVKSLYSKGSAKCKRARVQRKYGVKKDGTNFSGGFELQNRCGNVSWLSETVRQTYSGVCVRPFRAMQVNWKGNCLLCCNDYNGETAELNLKDNTLVEMWNSAMLTRYRAELQEGVRNGLCTHCNYRGGAYRHVIHKINIDYRKLSK